MTYVPDDEARRLAHERSLSQPERFGWTRPRGITHSLAEARNAARAADPTSILDDDALATPTVHVEDDELVDVDVDALVAFRRRYLDSLWPPAIEIDVKVDVDVDDFVRQLDALVLRVFDSGEPVTVRLPVPIDPATAHMEDDELVLPTTRYTELRIDMPPTPPGVPWPQLFHGRVVAVDEVHVWDITDA